MLKLTLQYLLSDKSTSPVKVEKINIAIRRKSLVMNTTKFPSELSHHDNFSELSSQLIENSPMIVGMFVTSFFVGEVFLLYFWNGIHPQALTFFLAITLIWWKR